MSDPFEPAIQALEAEVRSLEELITELRGRQQGGRPSVVVPASTASNGSAPAGAEILVEDAVYKILGRFGASWGSVKEILKAGPSVGRDLNENSVRWILHHGVGDGTIAKRNFEGRSVRYRLAKK